MHPDFGLTSNDYAQHRAGFPDSLFERLTTLGIGTPGQALVDLGTGTGSLARGFARRGCDVTAIDPSPQMLDAARELDRAAGVQVDYRIAQAEATGLETGRFDTVTAGQCWHWFERANAATEVRRLLKPGGQVVIAHFDWLPLSGNLVRRTEELIEAHNPDWHMGNGNGLYPQWLTDLGEAGFVAIETFSYDLTVPYSPLAWRGRIRASAGVGGSLKDDEVARFDVELAELLARDFPQETLDIPHRVFAVTALTPA